MLPAETQCIIDKHGIKYVLAQFVDIQTKRTERIKHLSSALNVVILRMLIIMQLKILLLGQLSTCLMCSA